jgi:hypothetical protein
MPAYIVLHKERASRQQKTHRDDGLRSHINMQLIIQALAPWQLPGCCAVVELVSRALFMSGSYCSANTYNGVAGQCVAKFAA